MARVKRGTTAKARHKKILKLAKGYRGRAHSCYRIAIRYVEKALQYQYRDRRNRKRDFRRLWVVRINAAARENGLVYSQFINGLIKLDIIINRKILSEMAVNDKDAFKELCSQVKDKLKLPENPALISYITNNSE